ncbi:MAG: 50S ribosomal protein L5 [Candidatus Harrisonbacteria bacterium CG10_big_fil_rev_8_21_14_0_10_40_38]|uniref:Large ribosomal subunit protein uL5 n=1 Tax=Candidatus Harrisonbacteria bacterium CG10_big_fil_rev_8_21_14_0_10_40_38 TaxID=1974583 RepID=A0A2H0USI5_9BACT|nr:MAG: 50S ribosomal protein L5 [Candidatus Harrisonbacteria bacterium CG10_big_fil_rev_8_21_14_0_10_40_38]
MTAEKIQFADDAKSLTNEIEKIVVNIGVGKISGEVNFEDKTLPSIIEDVSLITGQKPSVRSAKKSIAGFKLREGTPVGVVATLRGQRMVLFLEKLIKVVIPRIRDFRGIKTESVDEGGNLSIGVRENIVFPEINPEVTKASFGVQITIVPKWKKNKEEASEYFKKIGIPFKKKES